MSLSSTPASRDARAAQRFPTHFGGQLAVQSDLYPVIIANISRDGAKVRCISGLRLGMRVTLKANGLDMPGTVMWKSASTYGLRFAGPVDPLEIVRRNYAGLEHLRASRVGDRDAAMVVPQPIR
jgi:hypothetical protein